MGKAFDKVGISLIAALLSFLIFFQVTQSIILGAICAILSIAILSLILALFRPRTPKNVLTKRSFIRYVLLNGVTVLKTIVENSFSGQYPITTIGDHTIIEKEHKLVLIYYVYKFGSLSEEDVAKSYRLALANAIDEIYVITNHLDRKALAIAEYIPQNLTIINASTLYKYLLKKKLIPQKSAFKKKSGKGLVFLKSALKSDNIKYYVWAGLSTALLALLTPITTYYIVFSFVNLGLAIASMLLSERSEGQDRLFKN